MAARIGYGVSACNMLPLYELVGGRDRERGRYPFLHIKISSGISPDTASFLEMFFLDL